MKKTLKLFILIMTSALLLLYLNSCKQYRSDLKEYFAYWTTEANITSDNLDVLAKQNTARSIIKDSEGVYYLSSEKDNTIELTLHNPKNFKLNLKDSIKFNLAAKADTDYKFFVADGKLKLTLKKEFIQKYERSNKDFEIEIRLKADDGRTFAPYKLKKFKINTNPPIPKKIVIAQTKTAPYKLVLCIPFDEKTIEKKYNVNKEKEEFLHSDIKKININNEGYDIELKKSGGKLKLFPKTYTSTREKGLINKNLVSTYVDSIPAYKYAFYYNTDIEIGSSLAQYTINIEDSAGFKSVDTKSPLQASLNIKSFYVKSDGDDSGLGLISKPFASLQTAINNCTNASTVYKICVMGEISGTDACGEINGNKTISIVGTDSTSKLNANNSKRVLKITGSGKDNTKISLLNLTITGGNSTDKGGAVLVENATVTVGENCIISSNQAKYGGAMCASNDGKIILADKSKIIGNTSKEEGGGIALYETGTLIMNGGIIGDENASLSSPASLKPNKAGTHGGGVALLADNRTKKSIFTMNGGKIIGNEASQYGGGVSIRHGEFNMDGGSISYNKATNQNGGGVWLIANNYGTPQNISRFTMTKGLISENTAQNFGGGVFVQQVNATFTMKGGNIKKNHTNNSEQKQLGVSMGYGNFEMSGDAQIGDYDASGSLKDGNTVYKYGGGIIKIIGTINKSPAATVELSETATNTAYKITTKILTADNTALIKNNYQKFKIKAQSLAPKLHWIVAQTGRAGISEDCIKEQHENGKMDVTQTSVISDYKDLLNELILYKTSHASYGYMMFTSVHNLDKIKFTCYTYQSGEDSYELSKEMKKNTSINFDGRNTTDSNKDFKIEETGTGKYSFHPYNDAKFWIVP